MASREKASDRQRHSEPVLAVKDLVKYYGAAGHITKALRGVDMTVREGEFVGVMGPSGSGKTTLLNVVSTIDTPTSGTVHVSGRELTALRQKELARFRRERLGFIFQEYNLLDTLTVRENIALSLSIAGAPPRDIDAQVVETAQRLGISDVLDQFPYQVSGGEKQRAAAARAVIADPDLVLADEPTGNLDSRSAQRLLETIQGLNASLGATVMLVTHDPFAASYCRRILFINDGRLFNELVRGDTPRKAFFDEILDVLALLGGDVSDVR